MTPTKKRFFLNPLASPRNFLPAIRNLSWAALLLFELIAGSTPASAQTGTLYRLNKDSTFQQGCFPPCLCPIMIAVPVKGTFVLTPTGFDGLFSTYAVTDVNWLVTIGGTNTIVTGSGTYKFGGEFALQQQLSLDLRVGADKVQHFDSGLVTGPAPFPDIKVPISVNGQVCFDTVFEVSASPVPLDQIHPYSLLDGSTFQRGCFDACDCAVGPLDPITGTFALVPLDMTPLFREFAVVNVRWLTLDPSDRISVRGFGTYKVGGEFAVQQQLKLLLKVDSEDSALFDRGLVPGGGSFPRIDIPISISGAVCFDTVIDIHAAPVVISITKGSLNNSNNFLQMGMSGPSGSDVVVETSANLQAWTPVQTNALTLDGVDLSVPLSTNQCQFFRARLVP
jgi:hypothetical protein